MKKAAYGSMNVLSALLFFISLFLMPSISAAQVPQTINYQGYMTDSSGNPANGFFDVFFDIYDSANGVNPIWSERHRVEVISGVYSTVLGSRTGVNINVNGQSWLQVSIDENASGTIETEEILSPRQQLTSVPSALNSDMLDGEHASAFQKRVSSTCPSGSSISAINENGTVICEAGGGIISETDPTVNSLAKTPLSCLSGQVVKWSGTAWECAADSNDGGGTYTAGAGLELTGSTFSVSAGGITDASITGPVSEAKIDSALTRDTEVLGIVTANDGIGSDIDSDRLDGKHGHEYFSKYIVSAPQLGTFETYGVSDFGVFEIHNNAGVASSAVHGYNSGGYGLIGESSSYRGVKGKGKRIGVYGEATASGGITNAYGIEGVASGANGRGIYGHTTVTTGASYGVWGNSVSDIGIGVKGTNTHSTGSGAGVYGESSSPSGTGVMGKSWLLSGINYGVRGEVSSPDGFAVSGTGGSGTGVLGNTNGSDRAGVQGTANSSTTGSAGVLGQNYSTTSGYAVKGEAIMLSGETYGVYGKSQSVDGVGVFGETLGSSSGMGVWGRSIFPGITGVFGNSVALTGSGAGVKGSSSSPDGFGVHGVSDAGGIGVYGTGATGVKGSTSGGKGVEGLSSTGGTGVFGSSASGKGVEGIATSTRGINNGGYFQSNSTAGRGVYGYGGAYDFYAAGPGVDYGTASSIRWKSNIREIDGALDKVMKIRGVYYDLDKEHGGHHDMGFIAEEVGAEIPEVVDFEEGTEYATGMDYGRMTPVLLQAIKEQQGMIKVQQEMIEALRDEMEELRNQLIN